MKFKLINYKYVIAGLLSIGVASCDFGETNIDPDNPVDAPQASILPSVEAHLAFALYGDASRYAGHFTQHFTGTANQHFNFSQYDFFSKDVVNLWRNLYEDAFPDINIIIEKSADDGAAHYSGIAKVLKAYWLGSTTDLFGDIPYSEANKGSSVLNPAFDLQESLYPEIQRLLTEGISDLQLNSTKSPAGDDFIYGGDVDQWIKLARVLQARYALHLTKVDEAGAADDALAAINAGGFASNADDADFVFTATEGNPLAQFEAARAGDMRMGEFFVELMKTKNDPRLSLFVAPDNNGEYRGSPINVNDVDANASAVGPYYASPTTPVSFATYAEMKFIEAEALVIKNGANDAEANAAFRAAVTASMEKVGVAASDITDYLATINLSGTRDDNIRQIIEEKYVALFNNFETFTDWRRTGFPTLTSATGGAIPRQFPYSQEALDFNSSTPSKTITDKVWWDN